MRPPLQNCRVSRFYPCLVTFSLLPTFVHAQVTSGTFVNGSHGPALFGLNTSGSSVGTIFAKSIDIFLVIAGFLSVGYMLYSGIQLASAAGDEAKIEQAKKALIWSIVGTFVIMITYLIITASQSAAQGTLGTAVL